MWNINTSVKLEILIKNGGHHGENASTSDEYINIETLHWANTGNIK